MNMGVRYERSRFQNGRCSDMMRFCGEAVLNKQIVNEKRDEKVSEQPSNSVVDTQTQASYFKVVPAFNATAAASQFGAQSATDTSNSEFNPFVPNKKK